MTPALRNANIDMHIHPFLGKNSIVDVVEAMEVNNLDVVGLEALDHTIYPLVIEEAREHWPITHDRAGIFLPDGKLLLNAKDYSTRENLHVLTVGYSHDPADRDTEIREIIDAGLENNALVILDHPFVNNDGRTAGTIPPELEEKIGELCTEYTGEVALEWNSYCIPWVRKCLQLALNPSGAGIEYHDVNRKVEEFSEQMRKKGYNTPVLADTDLHGRNKRLLKAMGTARFIADLKGESAEDIVRSMREAVFAGQYENLKRYVSLPHFIEAYGLPILFSGQFTKPRA